jgi:hypothetical protein|tara:strand:+ start:1850 stop:2083 length:234 start_codon:yes stop_codon:yes gene_type:complete
MRKIVDVIALERELVNRLDVLNQDTVFLNSDKSQSKLNSLVKRLEVVRLIKDNFVVIQWLMGDPDITRAALINQDAV